MTQLLYLLFFCSGLSGLIYQVVWVRVFGNVFGNTIYSASLVIAVFMLGLGVGSYVVGAWADRRYALERTVDRGAPAPTKRLAGGDPDAPRRSPRLSLLRAYGYFELLIAAIGLGISVLLPHLDQVSAIVSSYSRDASGWYSLSTRSYLARAGIAIFLLTPITVLMGGTLTLLIRHLVRSDVASGGWRIAVLYGVNTAGAALGCFLTDFTLVPRWGLRSTQIVAVSFNLVAAAGALWLANKDRKSSSVTSRVKSALRLSSIDKGSRPLFVALALAMSGFAAMGMEILWFRHVTILLGGFRAVFSLLLTIILLGIGAGSLVSSVAYRRAARPAQALMVMQGLFIASTLLGLALADAGTIERVVMADPAHEAAAGVALSAESGWARALSELWFNARPILLEVAVPALLMGFSFPLANAIIQRAESSVGRRAGVLYLSNTVGAVCGSLAAGFWLLPMLGIQASATVLTIAAGLAILPLYVATRENGAGVFFTRSSGNRFPTPFAGSILITGVALGLWLTLPSNYVINRAQPPMQNEQVLTLSEGLTEVVAVMEVPGQGRTLYTNGHPMSSTRRLSQRYMRALAHIPLLSVDNPETVLVIGFGVGNTTHAATLHPSIRRIEVADLSRDILAHAGYFRDVNRDVLSDPRVVVYLNDGRHHLLMKPAGSYDLITLEPPPIGYAGVAALYSKEFYALARTRLKPKGYLSQWLPAYQVSGETTLAMIRAFVDLFPQAVLVSGAGADLLLIGANDSRIEIDPAGVATALSRDRAVEEDLRRLDLGSVREVVGTFVGSPQKLAEATRDSAPVSDDRPIQEYGVRSLLNFGDAVPASVVDLSQVAAWCPKCFADGKPVPLAEGLDRYLALLEQAYMASPVDMSRTRSLADRQTRVIAGSAYLGAVVPESADLHNLLGIGLAEKGGVDEAIAEFREALRLDPDSARTHWNLGAALASRGAREDAVDHLRRSVQLDPGNPQAHYDLGVTLASLGKLDDAIEHFQQALRLDPAFDDARRNLTMAIRQRR